MTKIKILTVMPTFDNDGPRNIRAYYLFKYLDREMFEPIVYTYKLSNETPRESSFEIERNPLGFMNFQLRSKKKSVGYYIAKVIEKIKKPSDLGTDLYEDLVKKDELGLKNTIIYISAPPSLGYKYVCRIRKLHPMSNIIMDIGDSLYRNMGNEESLKSEYYDTESQALSCASHLIVTNKETVDFYRNTYLTDIPISVIPQGFDPQLFYPRENSNEVRFKSFKLIFAGAIYSKLRPIDPLLKVLSGLEYQNIHLDLYSNYVSDTQIANVNLCGRVSQKVLSERYSEGDVLLFIDNKEGIQTPGKIYELLAMQKPILFLYNTESQTYGIAKDYPQVVFVKNEFEVISRFMKRINSEIKNLQSAPCTHDTWKRRSDTISDIFKETVNRNE